MAALRIQMEARRRETRTRLVRAAPTEARLADVVCRSGEPAGKFVVFRANRQTIAALTRREWVART